MAQQKINAAFVSFLCLAVSACGGSAARNFCSSNADCSAGQTCSNGVCALGSGGGSAGGSGGGAAGGSGGGSPSVGITNGGFENGLTGWSSTGTTSSSSVAESGESSAQVGSTTAAGASSVAQTFIVPANGGFLSFWYEGFCNDTVQYAYASATLLDSTSGASQTLLANTCTNTGQWVQVTSSALVPGDTVTLTLSSKGEVYQSNSNYTLFDNVAILTNAPGGGSGGGSAGGSGGGSGGGSAGGSAGGCGGGSAGGSAGGSGGGSAGGSGGGSGGGVTITGGSVDHLYFAVVGDSRPANIDDTANYPSAIISKIYEEINSLNPRPQFVVGTGDYMYANTTTNTAQPQAALYMQARANFAGPFFPAMGNHECDGYTADNCTSLTQSDNIKAFMGTILAPNNQTNPYYSIPINSLDGSWTAKFIFVACNAWSSTEQSWLTSTLAQSTTYTILARHEPKAASTGPCVSAAESAMSASSYNVSLVGHTHEFSGSASTKEIIVGNGGAPLDAGNYGFTTVERLSTGWQIKNYDYSTVLPTTTYTITP